MARIVRCRDVGFDCEGVIRADTAEEALAVHGPQEVTPEVVAAVRAVMRDE